MYYVVEVLVFVFFFPLQIKKSTTKYADKVQFLLILKDVNLITGDGDAALDLHTRKRVSAHTRVRHNPPPHPTPPHLTSYPPNTHKQSNGKGHRLLIANKQDSLESQQSQSLLLVCHFVYFDT